MSRTIVFLSIYHQCSIFFCDGWYFIPIKYTYNFSFYWVEFILFWNMKTVIFSFCNDLLIIFVMFVNIHYYLVFDNPLVIRNNIFNFHNSGNISCFHITCCHRIFFSHKLCSRLTITIVRLHQISNKIWKWLNFALLLHVFIHLCKIWE